MITLKVNANNLPQLLTIIAHFRGEECWLGEVKPLAQGGRVGEPIKLVGVEPTSA